MEETGMMEKLFTVYGPLGLGWIVASYLFKRVVDLQTTIMNAFLADTQAKLEMKAAFEKLSVIVEKNRD